MCYPCITYKDLAEHGTGGFGGSGWEGVPQGRAPPPLSAQFSLFSCSFWKFWSNVRFYPPPILDPPLWWVDHFVYFVVVCLDLYFA